MQGQPPTQLCLAVWMTAENGNLSFSLPGLWVGESRHGHSHSPGHYLSHYPPAELLCTALTGDTGWTEGQKGKLFPFSKDVCRANSGMAIAVAFPEPSSITELCYHPRARHPSMNLKPHSPIVQRIPLHIVYLIATYIHDAVLIESNAWRTFHKHVYNGCTDCVAMKHYFWMCYVLTAGICALLGTHFWKMCLFYFCILYQRLWNVSTVELFCVIFKSSET